MPVKREPYLEPYLEATEQYEPGFSAAVGQPQTNGRFDAITRAHPLRGKSVLDAGAGRGLDGVSARSEYPASGLHRARSGRATGRCRRASKLSRHPNPPRRFHPGTGPAVRWCDVIVFSGSLNTMPTESFYGHAVPCLRCGCRGGGLQLSFLVGPGRGRNTWSGARYRAGSGFCGSNRKPGSGILPIIFRAIARSRWLNRSK